VAESNEETHVVHLDDLHDHVTSDGVFCPCLPRRDEANPSVVVHNSYDGREIGEVCRRALLALGSALLDHRHRWTKTELGAFEHAFELLDTHYPEQVRDLEAA